MKFKRGKGSYKVPAHRDYYLTLVRPDGRRLDFYTPDVWRDKVQAQREADRKNAKRPTKYGQFIVEFKDYPESIGYELGRFIL